MFYKGRRSKIQVYEDYLKITIPTLTTSSMNFFNGTVFFLTIFEFWWLNIPKFSENQDS